MSAPAPPPEEPPIQVIVLPWLLNCVWLGVWVDQRWWNELSSLRANYPHHRKALRSDNFGIAVLSRFPFQQSRIEPIDGRGVPTIICHIETDTGLFRLIATHPIPPVGAGGAYDRNQQLAGIAKWAENDGPPVIVLGDLNTTPWSPYFNTLLKDGKLRDTRSGFGPQGTWPDLPPPFRIPIDHCLISDTLSVQDRRVGADVGSDHRPIIIDLTYNR